MLYELDGKFVRLEELIDELGPNYDPLMKLVVLDVDLIAPCSLNNLQNGKYHRHKI